jgi:hypothetical protein
MADRERAYWWISQGYNYEKAIAQQTLWSLPKKGRDLPDRRLLREMRPGDVVLHYSKQYLRAVSIVTEPWRTAPRPEGYRMRPQDGNIGWLVEVDVQTTGLMLHFSDIAELIATGQPGPLDKNGTPRQIYVASLTEEEARRLLDAAGASMPDDPLDDSLLGLPQGYWDDRDTDSQALARIRTEQGHLRRHLLNGRRSAPCALCGRVFPHRLLVAAHITARRFLTDAERRDFASAAMLTCTLGCDSLFEWGYVVVDPNGQFSAGRMPDTAALSDHVATLIDRRCAAHNDRTASRFEQHRQLHAPVEMGDPIRAEAPRSG